jgi:hypothetical protein
MYAFCSCTYLHTAAEELCDPDEFGQSNNLAPAFIVQYSNGQSSIDMYNIAGSQGKSSDFIHIYTTGAPAIIVQYSNGQEELDEMSDFVCVVDEYVASSCNVCICFMYMCVGARRSKPSITKRKRKSSRNFRQL